MQYLQNYLLAADVHNGFVGRKNLITTYLVIGCIVLPFFLLLRFFSLVIISYGASQSIFSTLLISLFRAPMSFYDSTPLGRILTRVSMEVKLKFCYGFIQISQWDLYLYTFMFIGVIWYEYNRSSSCCNIKYCHGANCSCVLQLRGIGDYKLARLVCHHTHGLSN